MIIQIKLLLFKEKNPDSNSAFVNCGVYLIKSTLKSSLPKKTSFSLEVDFFPKITDKGFYAFETKGNFIDIGTPESLEQAQTLKAKIAFAGLVAEVKKTQGSNGIWYKVRLGPYETKRLAESDKNKLKRIKIMGCGIWLWT